MVQKHKKTGSTDRKWGPHVIYYSTTIFLKVLHIGSAISKTVKHSNRAVTMNSDSIQETSKDIFCKAIFLLWFLWSLDTYWTIISDHVAMGVTVILSDLLSWLK